MTAHVVWDWNGTLFSDADAVLAATNDTFAAFGIPALSAQEYRTLFVRPLTHFYAKVFGRALTTVEFGRLDALFHDHYLARSRESALDPDALPTLAEFAERGTTQSLLSLWTHRELTELVEKLSVKQYFCRVDGRRGHNMVGKAEPLARHLTALGLSCADVVLVGDSLDDAAAARSVGTRCVLFDGGSHEPADLVNTGYPVVASLRETVRLLSGNEVEA